jgi:hypothetical protein
MSTEQDLSNMRPDITLHHNLQKPGAATLLYPASDANIYSRRVTLKWQQGEGPAPIGYKVYFGKSGEQLALINSTSTTEFSTSDLDYETTYKWKIIPYNSAGDSEDEASEGSFEITAYTDWDTENFNDGVMPDFWRQWKGVGIPSINHTEDVSQWSFTNWLNGTDSTNKAATMKVQGNNIEGWLVSPAFQLPSEGNDNELVFDLGLTHRDSSGQIQCLDGQIDDRFVVYMSRNPGMGGYTKLIEWNNTDSPNIYNNIPHTGTKISIPLNTNGYVYFGFFVQSTVDNSTVDLFIDNVTVRQTPNSPELQIDEAGINYGYVNHGVNTVRNLTIRNSGGGILTLANKDFQFSGTHASMFSIPNSLNIQLSAGQVYPLPINLLGNNPSSETNLDILETTIKIKYGNVSSYPLEATILPQGEIVVGNSVANFNVPTNVDWPYSYSQTIFLDSEINVAYQEITEIKYYWNGTNDPDRDLEVYMGSTKNESFAYGQWTGGMKKVYPASRNNSASYSNGVLTIPIDPPYIMMEESNLVIGVYDKTGSTGSGFFNASSKSTNRSMIYTHNQHFSATNVPTNGDHLFLLQAIPNISIKLVKAFEVIPGDEIEIDLSEDSPSVSIAGGAANIILPGSPDYPSVPDYPNSGISIIDFILKLFGKTPKRITLKNSTKQWGAYHDGSAWVAAEKDSEGNIVLDIPAHDNDDGQDYHFILADQNPTLPVELSHFSVTLNKENDAVIRWTTQSETGVNGFYIYRNTRDKFDNAELISSLIPATNSSNETQYSFTDKELYETGTYYYWLLVLDINGSENLTGPLTLQYNLEDGPEGVVPVVTTIKSIYPNPFNPSTTIAYSLKDKEDVSIHIYNTRGQLVYSVDRGTQDVGHYEYIWNGTSTNGTKVSSGMYFIRLKAGKTIVNKKAMLMK